jgi:hypothetical protein
MRLTCSAVVLAAGLLAARAAHAQSNVTFVPSLSVGTVYDDNLFARQNGDAGIITRLRPALEGNYESPTLRILSFASFDMQRSNHPSLNTFDARRHGTFDIRHLTTAKMALAFGLRYDRTETPGEINIESGILGERRLAERWELIPSVEYRVRPRTSIRATYAATTETLVGEIGPRPKVVSDAASVAGDAAPVAGAAEAAGALVSTIVIPQIPFGTLRGSLHIVRSGVSRQLSTRDELTVSYLGRRFIDDEERHGSDAVLVGWTRELAFGTRLSLQGGPRFSSFEGADAEIMAGLSRTTNRIRLAMDYWHGETIVLGIPGPVAVDSVTGRLIWRTSPRTELGTHVGVSNSTTIEDEQARVYRTTVVGSWTPNGGPYTLSASYGLDFQQGLIRRTLLSEDEVLRHTVRVNLTIAPRLSRTFRPTGEPPVAIPGGDPQ